MRRKKSVSYEEGLYERLKDSAYAAEYLNGHLARQNLLGDKSVVALSSDVLRSFFLTILKVSWPQTPIIS